MYVLYISVNRKCCKIVQKSLFCPHFFINRSTRVCVCVCVSACECVCLQYNIQYIVYSNIHNNIYYIHILYWQTIRNYEKFSIFCHHLSLCLSFDQSQSINKVEIIIWAKNIVHSILVIAIISICISYIWYFNASIYK